MNVQLGGRTLRIDVDRVDGPVGARLDRYLHGEPVTFEAGIDLDDRTDFQRQVLQAIRDVPYGNTITYGELAECIGKPGAARASQSSPEEMTCSSTSPLLARAVANACGSNPVPIVIPCHRVVAKNGLGGYSDGGPPVKARLLAIER